MSGLYTLQLILAIFPSFSRGNFVQLNSNPGPRHTKFYSTVADAAAEEDDNDTEESSSIRSSRIAFCICKL